MPNSTWPTRPTFNADHVLLLTYLSAVTFVIGVLAPMVSLTPRLGDPTLEQFVGIVSGESFTPRSHSLLGGIQSLFVHGDILMGLILLVFSLLFPLGKLLLLLGLCLEVLPHRTHFMKILSLIGKWSLLDVVVIAVLVVSFKTFPGGTRITPLWGTYVFTVSIVLSLLATMLIQTLEESTMDNLSAAPTLHRP